MKSCVNQYISRDREVEPEVTRRNSSGEEGSLGLIADKRAEEYFSKQQAARRAKLESSMLELRERLGLPPEQTL